MHPPYSKCISVVILLHVTKAADVTTLTDVLAIGVTESEAAVFAARGDCSTLQILQVRQRIPLHVPGVIH